ncbi:MAG TPA: hypothetical protein VJP40_07720 [bacterium]|nr:hypothetical protein [bacterium]
MTAPQVKKSGIFTNDLNLSESLWRQLDSGSAFSPFELLRSPVVAAVELFRPDLLPRFGSCGVMRNNSVFGCNYLSSSGRETKLGVSFNTYPGGLGFSLKFFLGGR